MDHLNFDKLFAIWERAYYTEPLMYSCMIALTIYSFGVKRKEKVLTMFRIYLAVGIVLILVTRLIMAGIIPVTKKLLINETANVIFIFFEALAFIYYYSKIFQSKKFRIFSYCLMGAILVCVLFYFAFALNPNFEIGEIIGFSFQINFIEFISLLLPCFYYFYNSIKLSKEYIPLQFYPSFWISIGLFFYLIFSLPFLLIGNTLIEYNYGLYSIMFAIHYTSLSFLFICLAKAFSCKAVLTT